MLKKKVSAWCNRYGRTKKQIAKYKKKHGKDSVPSQPRYQENKMKLNKSVIKKLVEEVLTETDGFPKLLKKNNEVPHN